MIKVSSAKNSVSIISVLLLLSTGIASAFTFHPRTTSISLPTQSYNINSSRSTKTIVSALNEDKTISDAAVTKKGNKRLDSETRKKLIAESIAPWRTLRLFLYFSLGSGAAVGGFINLTGLLAAMNNGKEFDMNTELLNLGIDFGAVIVFILLAKFDFDKKAELDDNVESKLERKKEQSKIAKTMNKRLSELYSLPLSIRTGEKDFQVAPISAVQEGAKQHLILVIGNRKYIKDALLGANLLKLDFSMSNVLVVPYDITADNNSSKSESKGFGDRPMWETQPYVAQPVLFDQDDIATGWKDYIDSEVSDAVSQSGPMVKQEGIAIVLANDGKIIQRGIGKVPWRQMVEKLNDLNAVPETEAEYGFL